MSRKPEFSPQKKLSFFIFCPIPEEQKPIHEYIELKNRFLPFSFDPSLWIRLKTLEKQLNLAFVIYEESSWYDGQIWEKPFWVIKNDHLLKTQKVQPALQKIERVFFFLGFLFCLFIIPYYSER